MYSLPRYICDSLDSVTCDENGTVKLVDGAVNVTEGRLEICVNGVWGTVCSDGLTDQDGFDMNAVRVVCRQLGFPEAEGEYILLIHGSQYCMITDQTLSRGGNKHFLWRRKIVTTNSP